MRNIRILIRGLIKGLEKVLARVLKVLVLLFWLGLLTRENTVYGQILHIEDEAGGHKVGYKENVSRYVGDRGYNGYSSGYSRYNGYSGYDEYGKYSRHDAVLDRLRDKMEREKALVDIYNSVGIEEALRFIREEYKDKPVKLGIMVNVKLVYGKEREDILRKRVTVMYRTFDELFGKIYGRIGVKYELKLYSSREEVIEDSLCADEWRIIPIWYKENKGKRIGVCSGRGIDIKTVGIKFDRELERSIVLHEYGHFIGFDHVSGYNRCMNKQLGEGVRCRFSKEEEEKLLRVTIMGIYWGTVKEKFIRGEMDNEYYRLYKEYFGSIDFYIKDSDPEYKIMEEIIRGYGSEMPEIKIGDSYDWREELEDINRRRKMMR